MKSIFIIMLIAILSFINCSGGGEEIVEFAKQEISSGLSTNTNLSSSLSSSSFSSSVTAKLNPSTPATKTNPVGSWQTNDEMQMIQIRDGGQGIYIKDKEHNGHTYSYYKDFNWKHSGVFVYITYTLETAIRDGNQIIREKELSEQTTYRISGDQLIVDNVSFYKK